MCGIFGWHCAGELTKSQKNKTRVLAGVLAHANDSRGGDSWGAYMHGSVFKGLGDMVGAGSGVFDRMANTKVCLAHTRKATHGTINIDNAHPFEVGKIVGAHNGIVSNHSELNWKLGRKCEVDSEHIFRNINEGLGLDNVQAWGAIEYINKEIGDSSAFIGRFNSGELSIAKIPDFGVIWSSNEDHLMAAISVSGLGKPVLFEVAKDKLYVCKNNELYEEGELQFDYPWYSKHKTYGATAISQGIYKTYSSGTTSIKTHNNEEYSVDARWERLRESGGTESYIDEERRRPYLFKNCADCHDMVLTKSICDNCLCCTMCCPGYCDRRQIGYSAEGSSMLTEAALFDARMVGAAAAEEDKIDMAIEIEMEEEALIEFLTDNANDLALERYRNVLNPNFEEFP